MDTLTSNVKKIVCYTFIATLLLGTNVIKAQEELAPNQNPNYKVSQEKYRANKDESLKTEGTTVQATYKAIDDMQIRQDRRDLRRSYRQERRLARINNCGYYSPYLYNNCNSYGYDSYTPYSYYRPYYGLNTIASTALLGLGLYWWLR